MDTNDHIPPDFEEEEHCIESCTVTWGMLRLCLLFMAFVAAILAWWAL